MIRNVDSNLKVCCHYSKVLVNLWNVRSKIRYPFHNVFITRFSPGAPTSVKKDSTGFVVLSWKHVYPLCKSVYPHKNATCVCVGHGRGRKDKCFVCMCGYRNSLRVCEFGQKDVRRVLVSDYHEHSYLETKTYYFCGYATKAPGLIYMSRTCLRLFTVLPIE